VIRLQSELDAAHLRLAAADETDWDWRDSPEDIAAAMLRSHPAKAKRIGEAILAQTKSTAPNTASDQRRVNQQMAALGLIEHLALAKTGRTMPEERPAKSTARNTGARPASPEEIAAARETADRSVATALEFYSNNDGLKKLLAVARQAPPGRSTPRKRRRAVNV
jgi:hypothetical protein